jgi:class 3 adenylate cyclase
MYILAKTQRVPCSPHINLAPHTLLDRYHILRYVILENTCDQMYTYQIDGTEARYIGAGDLHDPKYDYLEAKTIVDSILDTTSGQLSDSSNETNCVYKIRAYPSQEFEESHTTDQPMAYALALAAVFDFTSVVFLLYDYYVERRQKVVMKSAQQSGALVSSLFPEAVRDRIYEEQEAKNKKGGDDWFENNPEKTSPEKSAAIANLHPDCSVLFADIAGFTKWSSTRSPTQVFELLETIWSAFDKIANKRRVFKIETIGDCYLATTGLPNPQPDHAVIMVKFAADCLSKLRELVHGELLDSFGEDTINLAMRFGLHSGPVTAGVLRGEKSRFQIFGDTVNTAARMESNGLREKIQVSEATATLLIKAGKRSWVTARDELVTAKGKGDMQTYWVEVNSCDGKSVVTSTFFGDDKTGLTLSLGDGDTYQSRKLSM